MSEDKKKIEAEAHGKAEASASASISYISGFPKKQLEYAKISRDRAGEIETHFENSQDKLPERKKREHQQSVISSVVSSLAFLEGQKDWFKRRMEEDRWDIKKTQKLKDEVNWDTHLEDAFKDTAKIVNDGKSQIIDESRPYQEIETLRNFRNSLLHFDSEKVKAGKEDEEFRAHNLLDRQDFPENNFGVNNTYPFNWLTYEMAERSVRMSFTLWRFFGRELCKEDEFLKGVPRP